MCIISGYSRLLSRTYIYTYIHCTLQISFKKHIFFLNVYSSQLCLTNNDLGFNAIDRRLIRICFLQRTTAYVDLHFYGPRPWKSVIYQ